MIKHTIKDDQIHISIDKKDFSYRIPIKKLGKTIKWKVGEKESDGIIMKNVSSVTLKLFTKDVTDEKYVVQFKDLVQELAPGNSIDWKETLLAVDVQNDYNRLMAKDKNPDKKTDEEEIIKVLEKKYNRA
ncbi:MAG: hypothetical protein ACI9XP_000433 [Lentimonas sp.]|jgi:hypothetical protein